LEDIVEVVSFQCSTAPTLQPGVDRYKPQFLRHAQIFSVDRVLFLTVRS